MLRHSLAGHGASTTIISRRDFDFLLSMLNVFHLHLRYEVEVSIAHPGTDPRIGTFFVSPYITWLVMEDGYPPSD